MGDAYGKGAMVMGDRRADVKWKDTACPPIQNRSFNSLTSHTPAPPPPPSAWPLPATGATHCGGRRMRGLFRLLRPSPIPTPQVGDDSIMLRRIGRPLFRQFLEAPVERVLVVVPVL